MDVVRRLSLGATHSSLPWIAALFAVVLLRPPVLVCAQSPEPFLDLQTENLPFVGSTPRSLAVAADRFYFGAETVGQGRQLWSSDGTAAGTHLVRAAEGQLVFPSADMLTVSGARLFYGLNTPDYGHELWTSDGTAEGTRLVADLCPGLCGHIGKVVPLDGERVVLLQQTSFTADTLWVSDGTAAGSFPLVGGIGQPSVYPRGLTSVGDRALFTAQTAPEEDAERRLFVTDGTVDGTRRLGPERPAASLFGVGDRVVFKSEVAAGASELWITDGTDAGTDRLAVLSQPGDGTTAGLVDAVATTNGLLFLSVTSQVPMPDGWQTRCSLWRSDGTEAGTTMVVDLSATIPGEPSNCASDLVAAGPKVFFVYLTDEVGQELVVSDGTAAGTHLLELHAGPLGTSIDALHGFGDQVFFMGLGSPPEHPEDEQPALWASDGTLAGTRLIKLFGTPLRSDKGEEIITWNGRLYFSAAREAFQRELWTSDGTTEGTFELVDVSDEVSQPRPVLHAAGRHRLFFTVPQAPAPSARRLWTTDGTEAGTSSVQPSDVHDPIWEQLVARGDRVFYQATDQLTQRGLWLSDGSPEGTVELSTDVEPVELAGFGDGVCFAGRGVVPRNGVEPWCSDGTRAGTVLLGDLATDQAFSSSDPAGWVQVGDRIVFQASTPATGRELWESDGTPAGTRPLAEIEPGPDSTYVPSMVAAGENRALFLAYLRGPVTGSGEYRILELEGHPFRTAVGAVFPAQRFEQVDGVFLRGRYLLFLQRLYEAELWSTDGTELGTRMLRRIATLNRDPVDVELTVVGNDLYFVLREEGAGAELWASDGTAVGTRRVVDLIPGPEASHPHHLFAIPGGLLFSAWSPAAGEELWLTDGTEAGTRMVADLEPGPGGSTPEALGSLATDAGRRLILSAWRQDLGFELWRLEASELGPRPCVERDGRLCLGGGRYEVLTDWLDRRTGAAGRGLGGDLGGTVGETWFFRPDNLEVPIKILDGSAVNGHAWVFYGTLTDLAFWLSVTDLEAGASQTYPHYFRDPCGGADTTAFALSPEDALPPVELPPPTSSQATIEAVPCADDPTALCWSGGRFRATVAWHDQRRPGRQGIGTPVPREGRTGAFWFFRPDNFELYVKILDGRAINGHFWVFYGPLTDVAFDLTVTDTSSGFTRVYQSIPGTLCGAADTAAF